MKISVLTPSYNSGKYIERAIESVINQNYHDFEHIIVDGASNDNTLTVLKKYTHLKVLSEKDNGQSDAMNKAYSMSSGDIIVYLNADDEFATEAFNKIIAAFKSSPKTDMFVGKLFYTDPEITLTRNPSDKYLEVILYWHNLFPNNPVSYFYKRKVQDKIKDFPIDDHYSMDIWFLLKAYKKFKVKKIDTVLGTFHSDGNNKTAQIDTGTHLHKTIKNHLIKESPFLLPYFYYKMYKAR